MEIYKLKIINITKYYLYVETTTKDNGYIHISEVSHFYVSSLSEEFKVGDIVYGQKIKDYKGNLNFSLKSGQSLSTKKRYSENGGGFLGLKYLLEKMEEKYD